MNPHPPHPPPVQRPPRLLAALDGAKGPHQGKGKAGRLRVESGLTPIPVPCQTPATADGGVVLTPLLPPSSTLRAAAASPSPPSPPRGGRAHCC